jgi:hypothetical protein
MSKIKKVVVEEETPFKDALSLCVNLPPVSLLVKGGSMILISSDIISQGLL